MKAIFQRRISVLLAIAMIHAPVSQALPASAAKPETVALQCSLGDSAKATVDPKSSVSMAQMTGGVLAAGGVSAIVATIVMSRNEARALAANRELLNGLKNYGHQIRELNRASQLFSGPHLKGMSAQQVAEYRKNLRIGMQGLRDHMALMERTLMQKGLQSIPATYGDVRTALLEAETRTILNPPKRGARFVRAGLAKGIVIGVAGIAVAIFGENVVDAMSGFGEGELTQIQEATYRATLACLVEHVDMFETTWWGDDSEPRVLPTSVPVKGKQK